MDRSLWSGVDIAGFKLLECSVVALRAGVCGSVWMRETIDRARAGGGIAGDADADFVPR